MTVFSLPALTGFTGCSFELIEDVDHVVLKGGPALAAASGVPRWRARYTTRPLRGGDIARWRAWWARLRSGLHRFHGVPVLQKQPMATCGTDLTTLTRAVGGTFDGTGTVAAVTETTIELAGLPAHLSFSAGDFVGLLLQGAPDRYALHQVVADVTGDGVGHALLEVVPPVITTVFTNQCVSVVLNPSCLMVPEAGSFSGDIGAKHAPVSFAAIQAVL